MKHIKKVASNAPKALLDYRRTDGANYKGYNDNQLLTADEEVRVSKMKPAEKAQFLEAKRQPLKKAIALEQGYICCYCMGRISPDAMTVEHYIPQNRHPQSPYSEQAHRAAELDYMNLLGSCKTPLRDCSEIRGNQPLTLDPRKPEIETQVDIDNQGRIMSPLGPMDIELNQVLGLNDLGVHSLKSHYLKQNRRNAIDEARKRLAEKYIGVHLDDKKRIEKEIHHWLQKDAEGHLRPYCMAAVAYLRRKLKSAR